MNNTNLITNRKKVLIVLVASLLLFCVFVLSACNSTSNDRYETFERNLYYLGLSYDSETLTAYAVVSFKGSEDKLLEGETSSWTSHYFRINTWYNGTISTVSVNPQTIFSAVSALTPQEKMTFEDVEYNSLKVVLRYDTIYKSIKSDGEVRGAIRNYSHYFYIDETQDEYTFTLSLRNNNTANWYSILLLCAILLACVGVVIFSAKKVKLWQKMKKE